MNCMLKSGYDDKFHVMYFTIVFKTVIIKSFLLYSEFSPPGFSKKAAIPFASLKTTPFLTLMKGLGVRCQVGAEVREGMGKGLGKGLSYDFSNPQSPLLSNGGRAAPHR